MISRYLPVLPTYMDLDLIATFPVVLLTLRRSTRLTFVVPLRPVIYCPVPDWRIPTFHNYLRIYFNTPTTDPTTLPLRLQTTPPGR